MHRLIAGGVIAAGMICGLRWPELGQRPIVCCNLSSTRLVSTAPTTLSTTDAGS
jgi:hypothetical protein